MTAVLAPEPERSTDADAYAEVATLVVDLEACVAAELRLWGSTVMVDGSIFNPDRERTVLVVAAWQGREFSG